MVSSLSTQTHRHSIPNHMCRFQFYYGCNLNHVILSCESVNNVNVISLKNSHFISMLSFILFFSLLIRLERLEVGGSNQYVKSMLSFLSHSFFFCLWLVCAQHFPVQTSTVVSYRCSDWGENMGNRILMTLSFNNSLFLHYYWSVTVFLQKCLRMKLFNLFSTWLSTKNPDW